MTTLDSTEIVRTMIDYHITSNQQLWHAIEPLGDEAFCAENTYSIGSIRNHMVHLMSVDQAWIHGLQGHPRDTIVWLDPLNFATITQTMQSFQQAATTLRHVVWQWDAHDLQAVVQGMSEPRWQILLHLTTHGVDHRSQVLRLIHDANGVTFAQDMIVYLWQKNRT